MGLCGLYLDVIEHCWPVAVGAEARSGLLPNRFTRAVGAERPTPQSVVPHPPTPPHLPFRSPTVRRIVAEKIGSVDSVND